MNRSEFEYLRGAKDAYVHVLRLISDVKHDHCEPARFFIEAATTRARDMTALPDIVTVTDDRTVFAQEVITRLESRIADGNGPERLQGLREAVDLITAILRGENGKEEL